MKKALLSGIAALLLAMGPTQAGTFFQQHAVKGVHYKEATITIRKAGKAQHPLIREGSKTVGAGRRK
jgi:hypothetical protein